MAKQSYKYMNLNPFTVIVPGKRGVGVEFPTGYGSNDAWFSRACGPKLLTNMEAHRRHAPVSQPQVQPVKPRARNVAMMEQLDIQVEEETDHWKKANGLYICKHCDLFRTGSILAIQNHLLSLHKIDLRGKKPDAVNRTPVVAGQRTDAAAGPEDETQVEGQDAAVIPPVEEEGVPCPYCPKRFRNTQGLSSHVRSKHPEELSDKKSG